MAKHSSQGSPDDKSKTIANFTSNLKEHVTKYENHESSCDKCELKATSPHFFNVTDEEMKLQKFKMIILHGMTAKVLFEGGMKTMVLMH